MSTRAAAALAWGLFGLFLAIVLTTVGVILFGPGTAEDAFFLLVLGYALVGFLIASRLTRNAVGWLLLTIGLTMAVGGLLDSNLRSADAPLLELSAWLSAWTWHVWLILAAVFLPLVFPSGTLVSGRWRPVFWLGAAALIASVLGQALKPGPIDTDTAVPVENPFGVGGVAADVVSFLSSVGDPMTGVAFVLAAASLVVRFRRSRGRERQQLKWFASAGTLAAVALAVAMVQVLFGASPDDPDAQGGWLEIVGAIGWFTALFAVVIGIPLATGLAILRHRLYDIDVVIRRTLVYAGLTASLAATYVGTVLLLGLALGPVTEKSDLAIAGSTLAVAALVRPLRARIQGAVDRRFFRSRYDAAQTLEAFGARLRDELDLDAVSRELCAVAGETVQPQHISVWLRRAAA